MKEKRMARKLGRFIKGYEKANKEMTELITEVVRKFGDIDFSDLITRAGEEDEYDDLVSVKEWVKNEYVDCLVKSIYFKKDDTELNFPHLTLINPFDGTEFTDCIFYISLEEKLSIVKLLKGYFEEKCLD